MFLTALNLSHDFLSAIFGILRKFRIDIGIFFSKHIFFRNEKNIEKKMFWEKMRFFMQKQILRFFSIEKSFKIDFWKIDFKWLFNWKNRFFDFRFFSHVFFFFFFFSFFFFFFFTENFFCTQKNNIFGWDFFWNQISLWNAQIRGLFTKY